MALALVTGANRGIGLATCAELARQGVKVIMGCRNHKQGNEASQKLLSEGLDVEVTSIDVSDRKSTFQAAEKIHKKHGALDILVNNAGILQQGTILELSEEELMPSIHTNLLGPIHCIQAFSPQMVEKGYGRIVNVSSGWGSFAQGLEGPAIYSITKAALNAVTLTSAQALPPEVKINSLSPGWVRTSMGGSKAERSVEEGADTIIWLATLPENGPTGKFFRDREEIAW